MIAAAGQLDEAHVALEHDGLGLARNAGQAEPRRDLALVHHAVLGEVGSSMWWMMSAPKSLA